LGKGLIRDAESVRAKIEAEKEARAVKGQVIVNPLEEEDPIEELIRRQQQAEKL
jgi:hypothetical protein